ncbi:MAG: AAA family ATPase [Flavobacteriales bacterium]|nr:AAA family ATPase [Flavobacteriales bacterium]
MSNISFYSRLVEEFGLLPTKSQDVLFAKLEAFVRQREARHYLFVISGYAGTGKTSVLGAFVRTLSSYKVNTVLLAPTGRAAKVFSHKSCQDAFTIHKHIYRRKSKVEISAGLSLQQNIYKNTVFFVDEASMIGDYTISKDGGVSSRNLLEDLFDYVYSGHNCKLILIGDNGQLPPVGSDYSPALSTDYLQSNFSQLNIDSFELKEVLRQSHDSSILKNATLLRNTEWVDYPKFQLEKNTDLVRITGNELQDELESSYNNYGQEDTILITRSNKQANLYNQHIRGRILWHEEMLCSGDCLMVVKNNYFWLGDETKIGFIANGELIKIVRVKKVEEQHGFEFAHVIVRFVDYEDLGDVELIIHTESILAEGPNLPRERMKELFFSVEKDYSHIRYKKDRYDAILADPYFNALQVKYAYAVTCHKSQGGQWANVYIDQGFINDDVLNKDYYRWLYTALTRATDKVYLVNFADEFFE